MSTKQQNIVLELNGKKTLNSIEKKEKEEKMQKNRIELKIL